MSNVIYVNFSGPFRGRCIETTGEEVKITSAVARSAALEAHIAKMQAVISTLDIDFKHRFITITGVRPDRV